MKKERFIHIRSNLSKLNVDYENGLILNRRSHPNKHGYLKCSLSNLKVYVHQIIAVIKFGSHVIDKEINHIDGDKLNNSPNNLELSTRSHNVKHAYDNGLMIPKHFKGEKNGNAKLTENDVLFIKDLITKGYDNHEIAEKFNTTHKNISLIRTGKRWGHVNAVQNN